jgi:transcriptional regulator with XRE-family HTH domain
VTESTSTADEHVGIRLRSIRKERRLTLEAVERLSDGEFKGSVLGAYERGVRALSLPRLQRLALIYGVTVDAILNGEIEIATERRQRPSPSPADRGRAGLTIDMARMATLSRGRWEALSTYLARIQSLRGGHPVSSLTVRDLDVEAIAMAYGVDEKVLVDRLRWAGLCQEADAELLSPAVNI